MTVKKFLWLALLLFFALPASAQVNTTVTLFVTDTDSQQWFGGTWSAVLYTPPGVPPGPYYYAGTTTVVSPQNFTGVLDGTGTATFALPSNTSIVPAGTQWQIQACPQASSPCYLKNLTITGTTQNITYTPPGIRINLATPPPNIQAYQDLELVSGQKGQQYFNVTTSTLRVCSTLPCGWTAIGAGGSSLAVQVNSITLPTQPKINFLLPFVGTNNTGNSSSDISIPNFVGAGGSNAAGLVPAPGPTVHNPKFYLDETGIFSATPAGGGVPNPLTAVGLSNGAFPLSVLGSIIYGGPNPNIDVQSTGARPLTTVDAANSFNTTNFTASISSGSSTLSLCTGLAGSNLTTCQATITHLANSDGITVLGAGAANPLSTPGGTYTGTVNTNGTFVTFVSGQPFTAAFEAGAQITINAVTYTIAANNPLPSTVLTLTSTAGTQTGVAYSYNQFQAFPAIAAAPTGTGYVVPAPGNATAYTYKIVARTTGGAVTAASTAVTITNGVATLGAASLAVTSETKSGTTATATTAARSPEVLAPGMAIRIAGTSDDGNFGGWTSIIAVPNNTTFTYATMQSTITGGTASATGGSIQYYNCNHLILPIPTPGVFEYGIYGGAGGNTFLGTSHPALTNGGGENAYMKFDDYGSPMSANGLGAAIFPTTAPSIATANSLVTTIVSGAGTTTLTVANAATTTVTNSGVAKDDGPGIAAAYAKAATTNGGTGMVFISPAAISTSGFFYNYVVNSYLDLCTGFVGGVGISQAATLVLNDTMCIKSTPWHGDLNMPGGYLSQPQFGLAYHPTISAARGNPGILIQGTADFHGLNINNTNNMGNAVYMDGVTNGIIPQGTFSQVYFYSGTANANQDYLGIPFIDFSNPIIGSGSIRFTDVNLNGGPVQTVGLTSAPLMAFYNIGGINFDGMFANRRGLFFRAADASMSVKWDQRYENQGPITPLLTLWGGNRSGQPLADFEIRNVVQDTSFEPALAVLGCQNQTRVNINETIMGGGFSPTTGCPLQSAQGYQVGASNNNIAYFASQLNVKDGTFATTSQQTFATSVRLVPNSTLFTDTSIPPALTCVAQPGSGFWFFYQAVYATGGSGPVSQPSATECNITPPQTVSIPALVPGATGYQFFYNNSQSRSQGLPQFTAPNSISCSPIQPTGLSFTVWPLNNCGTNAGVPGSGPVSIDNDVFSANKFVQGPLAAPAGIALANIQWFDSTSFWPSFKPNNGATHRYLGVSGAQTIGHTACFNDTTTGDMSDCAPGGGGTPGGTSLSVQYNNAGSFGGVTAPTVNGTYFLVYPVTSSVAVAPTTALAGLPGRTDSSSTPTLVSTDRGTRVILTNPGATAVSIASASSFGSSYVTKLKVTGSGNVPTITPTTSTINGASTLVLRQGQDVVISSPDNVNYQADVHDPPIICGTALSCVPGDNGLTLNVSAGSGDMIKNAVNTMGASGTLDGSAMATTAGMKVPVGAGAIPTADGAIANNSTNHTLVTGSNGTTDVLAVAATGTGIATTCTNQVVTAVSGVAAPTCSTVANAMLANASTTVNGQTATLGSTANVNVGATTHGVAINEGNGNAIGGTAVGATNAILAGVSAADPAFKSLADLSQTLGVNGAGSVNVMTATLAPVLTANAAYNVVFVKPNLANTTTTPTLNVNGAGALTITKCGTTALVAGDYNTTSIAMFVNDGTEWQLLNPQASTCSGAGLGDMIKNATNTMGASGTLDGSAMATTAGMKTPVGAGAVPTADGAMANNSTNHTFVFGSNGTTGVVAMAATGTGTATTCTNQFLSAISGIAAPTCSTVANAALANSSVTFNGQAVSLGSSGNVNTGATAHSVAINQGNGSAMTGVGAGTTGQFLRATTSADPTYSDFPDLKIYPAAACTNATAGAGWNIPATNAPTVACRAGTNNLGGVLQWANNNTTTNAQFGFQLPNDWDTGNQPYINIYYGSGANTSGTVKWTFSSACTKADGSVSDDPAFVAETTTGGKTMAVANRMWSESVQFANITSGNNCIAGSNVVIKITSGNGTATSTVNVDKVTLTVPRLLTVQAN